ncbi:MAG: hypothetical protein HQ402_03245 [Parcubacteria group bacterium]|nr:hypothetical protein [Parcubacteria group bacterium]
MATIALTNLDQMGILEKEVPKKPINSHKSGRKGIMARKRAFVSVTDKRNLGQLKRLTDVGWEIVSTGGTAKKLNELGIPCTSVEDVTGFPEILDGRVKSMHPLITGAMLGDTTNPVHIKQMAEHDIEPFHLVIVNLYDFNGKPGIENIDIGGPTALRSAAKNGENVLVVIDPSDYDMVIDQILNSGNVTQTIREHLVWSVFEHTAAYDTAIASWMNRKIEERESIFAQTPTAQGH